MCYGMSKMTVVYESTSDNKRYYSLQLAEFLELIGRVAEIKYRETSGLPLVQKIEFVLDALLPVIGAER